jgi:hypothetical protein
VLQSVGVIVIDAGHLPDPLLTLSKLNVLLPEQLNVPVNT